MNITKTQAQIILCLIVATGFLLRVWGINFGLPELNHADEPIVVNHALAYGLGDFNPHFFNIPPLTSYILFAVYGIYFLIGHLVGQFPTKDAFLDLFLRDPSSFYLMGRLVIGVLFGVASIGAIYKFSRVIFGRAWSLVAVLMLSLLFLPVQLSHFIYPDSPLLFSILMALYFYLKIWKKGRSRDYIGAIIATGVAIAFKYNAALLLLPFLVAHYLKLGTKNIGSQESSAKTVLIEIVLQPLFLVVGVSIVFFLLNPYFFLDFRYALKEMAEQGQATGFTGWTHHLSYSLRAAIGLPLMIFFFASLFFALFFVPRYPYLLIIYAYTVIVYTHLVFVSQPYARYGILLIPSVLVFTVFMIREIASVLRQKYLIWLILAGLLYIPATSSVSLDQILSRGDTRDMAKAWFEKNVPSGSTVFVDIPRFQPRLAKCRKELEDALAQTDPATPQAKRIRRLLELNPSACFEVFTKSSDGTTGSEFTLSGKKILFELKAMKQNKIQYIALTRMRPDYPSPEMLKELREQAQLIARFSPYLEPAQEYSFDKYDLTGAPTALSDLKSRSMNGHLIEVYRLQ